MTITDKMTEGEFRVDLDPADDDVVTSIKAAAAKLIDMINNVPNYSPHHITEGEGCVRGGLRNTVMTERVRLIDLAKDHAELAAMYATKAAEKV